MLDQLNKDGLLSSVKQNRPAGSWGVKFKKKMKIVPPRLGLFRPVVGQCCNQCTPDSLRKNTENKSSSFGFHNILSINEKHTRYRGWLVRRVCCALFVSGRKVYPSPVGSRMQRVCQSNRVKEALAARQKQPEGGDGPGRQPLLTPFLPLINTCISPGFTRFVGWLMLKMFASVFGSIYVNLNHLPALHRASQKGSVLVYVYVRQSVVDCALIPLVLFCHNLRVPYTACPLKVTSSVLRSVLQKVGVMLLPHAQTEQDAETDGLYSAVTSSLVRELLHEGQALSVGVSAESGRGGLWLDHITQLIKERSVPDVCLVPVGISYCCVPKANAQVGLCSLVQWMWSALWKPGGSVKMDLGQPFSLKEMCDSGRCSIDDWLPLQDLLLPVILSNRSDSVRGRRSVSWLLPSPACEPTEPAHPQADLSIALILHLLYSATSFMSVMSTSLMATLLLHRHRKGVSLSVLCRDVAWLTEELLLRKKDVGFGGTLAQVVHYSLTLLTPHLIIAASPSRKDIFIVPRPRLTAMFHLSLQAQIVTRAFILESVGACAVSAMLSQIANSGVSGRVRSDGVEGDGVKGDLEFDVALCRSELTEHALRLLHLLPPGFTPPCQSSYSLALDAVDSLVCCGILIMEEIPRAVPVCDFWKSEGALTWTASDDPYHSDSDCEEEDSRSYKITQPSQCPDMLFFLCNMLAGPLRALSWTTSGLEHVHTALPEAEFIAQIHSHLCDMAERKKEHYESCSEEAAYTAVRTLIDLGVLVEERNAEGGGGVCLRVSPLFHVSENRQKLQRFILQYLYS
ncbi:glycerol-3-phosphate acyltransferase 2, mitochondrial [Sphaeramia orbicularis]|uniref:glycerol-3-phosphate acyltransferase 2, mitochondrial n=1 Tax=Sphaeramia orbicularis TaxID=375764 RepID=UPI0011808F1D|nr:glycerol-3-phosphate acyltransferase 2, mitochondrial-like [Sphaeramia orbicularis]